MTEAERIIFENKLRCKKEAAKKLNETYRRKASKGNEIDCNKEFLELLGLLVRISGRPITHSAEDIGISRVHLYKIMKGNSNPTLNTLSALLRELDLTIQFIPKP